MLHDYAHCFDYTADCPEDCFRAQLVKDLYKDPRMKNVPVSWQSFVGLPDCLLPETEKQKKEGDFS